MEVKYEEKEVLKRGQSYPAVLVKVEYNYDDLRGTYVVSFVYKVYLSNSETVEIIDRYCLWDAPRYRSNTIGKLIKTASAYNLILIGKDYRNEISIVNAFSWLVGTRVELSSYRYKGIRYKVVSSERNDSYRVNVLWKCLKENNIDSFEERLKQHDKEFEELLNELDLSVNEEKQDDFTFSLDDIDEYFNVECETKEERKKKHKRGKSRR